MKHFLKIPLALLVLVWFFPTIPIFAAQTFFTLDQREVRVGNDIVVGVFLNTESRDINAVEGKILFPEGVLALKQIKDGNSILNFWVEKPVARKGEITFSGIIPGGYQNNKGLIFSLIFTPKQTGSISLAMQNIRVLLNDGNGTEVKTTVSNLSFVVLDPLPEKVPVVIENKDAVAPEVFEPVITSDPNVYEGKNVLVFTTQDKESGIDHYLVCEGTKECVRAESPYLLKDQYLDKEITVLAVDKNGNTRTVSLPAQKELLWYQNRWVVGSLVGISLLILLVFLRKIYGTGR
jgi:hypothetical protein